MENITTILKKNPLPFPTSRPHCSVIEGGKPVNACPECGEALDAVYMNNPVYLASVGKEPHWTDLPCRKCEERRAAAEREAHLLELRLKSCDLSRRFSEKSFEDFTFYGTVREKERQGVTLAAAREFADGFAKHKHAGTWMLFMGGVGTGKGHLCAGILNQIIRSGYSGLFTKMPRLLREIKDTYSRYSETTQSEIINQTVRVDLLIVDEVGVQFGTETERMIIYEILDQRYEAMLPVILTTNCTELKALENCLGERVIDRLYEGASKIIRFDWQSYRKHQRNVR